MRNKKEIRKHFLNVRANIPDCEKEYKSEKIAEKLLKLPEYKSAETVFIYVSLKNEAGTLKLIEKMRADNKKIAVPLCNVKKHTMSAVVINSLDELKKGAYSILEPESSDRAISADMIDFAVIPAVAFDMQNNRLGMGGGYYDRFLSKFSGTSVGIAFSECVVDCLPVEEYDKKVDIVLSE